MTSKKCPSCNLINTASAEKCDCGFDFSAPSSQETYAIDSFLFKVASALENSVSHKPKSKIALGRTMAFTALLNLITIPLLGRASFGISRNRKKSASEIVCDLNGLLFKEFSSGAFSDSHSKAECSKKLHLYKQFLSALSDDQRMDLVSMALSRPAEYKKFVDAWIWRLAVS